MLIETRFILVSSNIQMNVRFKTNQKLITTIMRFSKSVYDRIITRLAIIQNITLQVVGIFKLISTMLVTKSLILNGYVWSRINVKIYVDIFMCLTHKYHLLLLFTYNTSRKLKIESARVYDCREIRSGGKSQKWSPIIKVFLFSNHLRSILYPQKNCLALLFWYFSLTILNRISLYNSPYL